MANDDVFSKALKETPGTTAGDTTSGAEVTQVEEDQLSSLDEAAKRYGTGKPTRSEFRTRIDQ